MISLITKSLLFKIFMLPCKALSQMIFLVSEIAFECHVPLNPKLQTLIPRVSSFDIKKCLTSKQTANQTLDLVLGKSRPLLGKCLNKLLTIMIKSSAIDHATPYLSHRCPIRLNSEKNADQGYIGTLFCQRSLLSVLPNAARF